MSFLLFGALAVMAEPLVITDITEIVPGTQKTVREDKQDAVQSGKVEREAKTDRKAFSFLMSERSKADTGNTSSQALNVSLGLIFILLLIFSMAWFMRKMGYSNISGQGNLKILATLNLGQKEKIALVQVGKQQLLVGVTASQINTLHVLDEPVESIDEAVPEQGFAKKLSESLANLKSR